MIELLAILAIIAVLLSLLLPSLGKAREKARRVECLSNQRQLVGGWTLHASDNDGNYPKYKFAGGYEHIHWLYNTDIVALRNSYGINLDWEMGCPNRNSKDWRATAGSVTRISYFIMVGRDLTGWSLSTPDPWLGVARIPWESPQRAGQGKRRLPMVADIDEYRTGSSTMGPGVTSVSHTSGGGAYSPPNTAILPEDLGSEGVNVGYEDGSARFQRISEREAHRSFKGTPEKTGFW